MKTLFFTLFCCLFLTGAHAQISSAIRVGWAFKSNQPTISPAINFEAHHITLGAEMIVNPREDSPAQFGVKLSYQVQFIEVGGARYYELFSLDKYDSYKNGWVNAPFVAGHYKSFFLQYEYLHGSRYSIGFRQNL